MQTGNYCWVKGLLLLVLGALFLLGTLGVMEFTFTKWWPLFLILGGLYKLCCGGDCCKKE